MDNDHAFEHEVLRVARHRWITAEYSGSEMIGGRERDGIFITEECVHLIECTTSRSKAKAMQDLNKMYELYLQFQRTHSEKSINCWFITRDEPTADQRSSKKMIRGAPENIFHVVSFAQFQSKLVDCIEYLHLRDTHKFGSIYDPRTNSATGNLPYIESGIKINDENTHCTVRHIADLCLRGHKFTLLGDYGVGKSMTLRQVYRELAMTHRNRETHKFPIYLNLREHQGQSEPAEILERHARSIGFPTPSQLVRAWRVNFVVLILDGFDEISSMGMQQGAWRKLRDARHASQEGLRRLILDSPAECGIAIAGREHFFNNDDERYSALGQTSHWREVRLDEFNEAQVIDLAKEYKFTGDIPAWIPFRPLLLSTLFAKNLDSKLARQLSSLQDPVAGWNLLLDEVCNREARIEAGVSGENVRTILEALATFARGKENGLGPLLTDDIMAAFRSACGRSPPDEALVVLQRLPGLGKDPESAEDSRTFVDIEFADACRAGDFARFCADPYDEECAGRLESADLAIDSIGIAVSVEILHRLGFNQGRFNRVVESLHRKQMAGATLMDLLQLALKSNYELKGSISVYKSLVDRFEIDGMRTDLALVTFSECYFNYLEINHSVDESQCPQFNGCLIQELEGRISANDLPKGKFSDTYIEAYLSSSGTADAAMKLKIPIGAKVLVTALKRLFVQSLSGRKENAFFRGLDGNHQAKVTEILSLLKSHSLATKSERAGDAIWIPVRRQRSRVLSIIATPSTSTDPVIVAARKL